jgi:hypothetical protein
MRTNTITAIRATATAAIVIVQVSIGKLLFLLRLCDQCAGPAFVPRSYFDTSTNTASPAATSAAVSTMAILFTSISDLLGGGHRGAAGERGGKGVAPGARLR